MTSPGVALFAEEHWERISDPIPELAAWTTLGVPGSPEVRMASPGVVPLVQEYGADQRSESGHPGGT